MNQATPNKSSNDDMLARYERAQRIDQGHWTKRLAFNTSLAPHWLGDSDCFWYQRDTKTGQQYRLVDADNKTNQAAFNHAALASTLTEISGEQVDQENLPLSNVQITHSPRTVRFSACGGHWEYDDGKETCVKTAAQSDEMKISPDGKRAIFSRDYNLWLKDIETGEEQALTQDGERFYAYGGTVTALGGVFYPLGVDVLWSPDSKRLLTQVIDSRNIEPGMPLVQHVPADGGLRPVIERPDRRVAYPGDKHVEAWQLVAIDVDKGRVINVDYDPFPINYTHYLGYFPAGRGWWNANSQQAYFIYQEIGGTGTRVLKCDTHTGEVTVLLEEEPEAQLMIIPPGTNIRTFVTPLPDTNELIWYSERSGWAHLYLVDVDSGEIKNSITQGDWVVRGILHVDTEQREILIQTGGRIAGRNPYYQDICRVHMDTGKLTPVVSTDHEYVVYDQKTYFSSVQASSLGASPSGRFVVTTRSRVDEIPVSLLFDRDAEEPLVLETADVSGLPDNWQ